MPAVTAGARRSRPAVDPRHGEQRGRRGTRTGRIGRRALLVAGSILIASIALGLWGRLATSGGAPAGLSISLSPEERPRPATAASVTRSVPFARTRASAARLPAEAQTAPRAVPFRRGPPPASLDTAAGGPFGGESPVPAGALTASPAALAPVQTNNVADYPGLGIDGEYVYVTANMYNSADVFQHVKVWAIRKAALLSGSPTLTWTEFIDPPGTLFSVQPAHSFGTTSAEYFVHEGYVDNPVAPTRRFLRLSRVAFPGGTATWEDMGFLRVSSYPVAFPPAAPQAGTADRIDTNDARLLNAVYRNGSLYTTQHVPSGDGLRTEVAWYQIDPARATPTGDNAPVQQGRVADPVRFFYYPSVAVNAGGSVVLGFSGSDGTIFASAFCTGRAAADPDNTTRPVAPLRSGDGPYAKDFGFDNTSGTPVHRWGDFSATSVDPVDDTTFWTLQEYAGTPHNTWATWWGHVRIPAVRPRTLVTLDAFPGLIDPEIANPEDGVVPPDTMGAAGPAHLVSVLNSAVGIFDKPTGAKTSEVSLQGFWAELGTEPGQPAHEPFDPKILYDQYSGHFVVVTLGGRGTADSWVLMAVSRTSDPNDGFDQWAIDADVEQVPAAPPPPSLSGRRAGGGGGCVLARPGETAETGTAGATLFLLFAPALLLALRKTRGRNRG